jgi:hypothetical protein
MARGHETSWLGSVSPVAVIVLAAAWQLAQGIDHRFISFSDGVYTYIASVVAAHGPSVLYHHIVLSQPPAIVLGAAGLWKVSPHVETLRMALAVVGVLTALLTYAVARDLGLSRPAAVAAAAIATAGPVHSQFGGLDGEALLTPLALVLILLARRSHHGVTGVALGLGLLVKVTWAPFLLAGLVAVWIRSGFAAALRAAAAALAVSSVLYGTAMLAFGWHPADLLNQIVTAESNSGSQTELFLPLLAITALMWWPLLPLAWLGRSVADIGTALVVAAGLLSAGFMFKQGTFQNVLDPVEPFLTVLAVAGFVTLWSRREVMARALALTFALGIGLHAVSVMTPSISRVLPLPVGATILDTRDQSLVDRAAAAVDAAGPADRPVLVNPLIAVVAHRQEIDDQADWFILHAMAVGCATPARQVCGLWDRMKAAARSGAVASVSVDSNVTSFDPSFANDALSQRKLLVFGADKPPLHTTVFREDSKALH